MVEAVHVPAHLAPPASLQAKQLRHLHTQPSLGQSCHRQNKSWVYACRVASVLSGSLRPCGLWPVRLLCQRGGFFRQEYWSVLANTGSHTFLDHYISCCPSCQLPLVPGAARIPETQATAPPAPMVLTGAFLQGSLSSKPQWMTHMHRWR